MRPRHSLRGNESQDPLAPTLEAQHPVQTPSAVMVTKRQGIPLEADGSGDPDEGSGIAPFSRYSQLGKKRQVDLHDSSTR